MRPAFRLLVAMTVTIACFLASPARSGDWLPQTGCDTLSVAGATVYEFTVWVHTGAPTFCTTEVRPRSVGSLAAVPITSWSVPEGWTAEWIPNEPGAIVLRGCLEAETFGPPMRLTMAGRAGALHATFYDPHGNVYRTFDTIFWCGSIPVPAAPATWGRVKGIYR